MRTRSVRPMLVTMLLVLGLSACATAARQPRLVSGVPVGRYEVTVSEFPGASSVKFAAIMFVAERGEAELVMERVQIIGPRSPDDYRDLIGRREYNTYEIPGANGAIQGYVVVPAGSDVTVWPAAGRATAVVVRTPDYLKGLRGPGPGSGGGGDGGM